MNDIKVIGANVWYNRNIIFGENITIGHNSCIGYGKDASLQVHIGNNVSIGAFCIIELDTTIEDNVDIDHYCRVSRGSIIRQNSKILYGVQIFEDARIGQNCIIGGDVADRVVVEDNVTFMGEIAHSHRNPNLDWDSTIEPSPTIKYGSVVGVNALIIGGVTIGPQSYVGAGEVVRHDIPPRTVLLKGKMSPIEKWKGLIRIRE